MNRWIPGIVIGLVLLLSAVYSTPTLVGAPPDDDEGDFPSRVERLRGLAEVWGMVYYFHPALRDPQKQKAWETELLHAIPSVEAAETVEEYVMALQGMIAKLSDGGTTVLFSGEVDENGELVSSSLPIRLSRIDGQVVISAIDASAPGTELLAGGMEVLSVDGVPVEEYLVKWLPVASGRTERLKCAWLFERLLSGQPGSEAAVVVRDAAGKECSVDLARPDLDWNVSPPSLTVESVGDGRYVHVSMPSVLCPITGTPGIYSLYGLAEQFSQFMSESDHDGVILDLRAGAMEFGSSFFVDIPLPQMLAWFIDDPWLTSAGYAQRMHEGLQNPIRSMLSDSYGGAWTVRSGAAFGQSWEAFDDSPLVVLVDRGSFPSVAEYLAPLRESQRAVIIGEVGTWPMRQSYTYPLPGGLGFRLRLSVPWDGEGEVRLPVVEVSPSVEDLRSRRDVALETAVTILDDWKNRDALATTTVPPVGEPLAERPWPADSSLSHEERLLGLFKLWSAIRYFYPFPEMIAGDWNEVLSEFIPRVAAADDDYAHYHELQHMMARINDGHAFLGAGFPAQYRPPIEIREIEGEAVIVSIDRNQSFQNPDLAGLEVGMIVTEVDGKPIADCVEERLLWVPGATPQHRRYWAHNQLLTGPESTLVKLRVENGEGDARRAVLVRTVQTLTSDPSSTWGWLSEEIGFIDLTRIDNTGLEQAIGEFVEADGLVVDLRGYPSSVGVGMALDFFMDQAATVALIQIPLIYSPDADERGWRAISQRMGSGAIEAFEGAVVILTDVRAVSAAEYAQFSLLDSDRIVIVGEPTAGTTGNITYVEIPGPAYAGLTGEKVLHADGRPFQGIGILPDVGVHPTIQGIREGRDEILEKGIEVLCELIAQRRGND